jgi:hypothetical protein
MRALAHGIIIAGFSPVVLRLVKQEDCTRDLIESRPGCALESYRIARPVDAPSSLAILMVPPMRQSSSMSTSA